MAHHEFKIWGLKIALTPTKQYGCEGWGIRVTDGPKGRSVQCFTLGDAGTALKTAISTAVFQGLISSEEYHQITGGFNFTFGGLEVALSPGKNRRETWRIKATISTQKGVFEVFTEESSQWLALRNALSESVYKGHLSLEEYQALTKDPLGLGTPEHIKDLIKSKMAFSKNGLNYMVKAGPFAYSGIGRLKE